MDLRKLKNLFELEEFYCIRRGYFNAIIDESVRLKLVTWMLEICEEENLTDVIFSQAVSIFDRFMLLKLTSSGRIGLEHVQLLGCVSLLLASKLHAGTDQLNAVKLVDYTASTIRLDELLDWELYVLETLSWDIASVCANDYVDFYLDFVHNVSDEQRSMLRKHTLAYTALCSTDFKFAFQPASMVAAACLLTAADSLHMFASLTCLFQPLVCALGDLAQIDIECLLNLKELVGDLVTATTQSISSSSVSSSQDKCDIQFEDDYDFDLNYNCHNVIDTNALYEYSPSSSSIESVYTAVSVTASNKKQSSKKKRASGKKCGKKNHYNKQVAQTQYCSYYILTPPQPNTLPLPTF
jgi:cyclin D2